MTKDPCPYCGKHHHETCPRVSAMEYYPDGKTIKRVEFHGSQPFRAVPQQQTAVTEIVTIPACNT